MSYINSDSVEDLVNKNIISISPYDKKFQGPNMYYCHMGNRLLIPKPGKLADTINLSEDLYDEIKIDNYYDLKPGEFVLAELFQTLKTDKQHIIRLFNSSSLARLGVVQCAVGMVNPGCGNKKPLRITLELSNTGNFIVRLYPTKKSTDGEIKYGTEVLKVAVATHEAVTIGYEDWSGSLYANDEKVAGSKIHKRFKNEQ
jgi:deoxycytidine triphosphate deaminase